MPTYRTFKQHLDPSYKPKRILALDGGGIRGLLTAGLLQRVEDLLRDGRTVRVRRGPHESRWRRRSSTSATGRRSLCHQRQNRRGGG